jgi:filamin
VTVVSPTGQNIPVKIINKSEEVKIVEFVPTITGHYKTSILYGGEQVSSSPITFAVSSKELKQNDTRAMGNGLEVAQRGKETSFVVFSPACPNVQIEPFDDSGERIEPKIKALNNNEWKITYTILSVGKYEIRASCPNKGPLSGSPWIVSCVDTSKVQPVNGWSGSLDQNGRLILPVKMIFETTGAGPGELEARLDGIEIKVEKLSNERFKIYIPADGLNPGEHDFDLTWNSLTVSQCPVTAFVTSQQAADKIHLTGRGLSIAQTNETNHFTIDAKQAEPLGGRPEVTLVYQDGFSIPVTINQPKLDEPIFEAFFNPPKSSQGPLNLSVKWGGRLIKGCPLSIPVGKNLKSF